MELVNCYVDVIVMLYAYHHLIEKDGNDMG